MIMGTGRGASETVTIAAPARMPSPFYRRFRQLKPRVEGQAGQLDGSAEYSGAGHGKGDKWVVVERELKQEFSATACFAQYEYLNSLLSRTPQALSAEESRALLGSPVRQLLLPL